MDSVPEITDFAKVVEPHLNGGQLVSYSRRYLTKPGDNYGSLMLSITANVRRPDGTIEELPLVAKLPPITNPMFWDIFQPEITSPRENAFYQVIAPAARQIQLDAGIPEDEVDDVFAKCYGCRISLDENATTVDRDAVLVLENLQNSGYKAGKRQVMFDYEHIKVILKYVAKYHALPIALRLLHPEKFQKEIYPKYYRFYINEALNEETSKLFQEQNLKEVKYAIGEDKAAFEHYKEVKKLHDQFMTNPVQCEHGLFTTLAHYDMWINNLMVLYDENGAPKKVKIVDFQVAQYESLAHDLVFLFLTSVETEVLVNKYEELMKLYYDEFIECLRKTKCDTSAYSYEKFIAEMNRIGPIQIAHALYMSRVLAAEQEELPENFENLDLNIHEKPPSPTLLKKLRDIFKLSKKFGYF